MGENGGVNRTVRVTRALASLLVTCSEETLLDLCAHEEDREKEKAEVKTRVRVGVHVIEEKKEERTEEKEEQSTEEKKEQIKEEKKAHIHKNVMQRVKQTAYCLLQVAVGDRKQKHELNANNNSPQQATGPDGEYPYFCT